MLYVLGTRTSLGRSVRTTLWYKHTPRTVALQVEMKARLPGQSTMPGLWPAFWIMVYPAPEPEPEPEPEPDPAPEPEPGPGPEP